MSNIKYNIHFAVIFHSDLLGLKILIILNINDDLYNFFLLGSRRYYI